MVPSVFRFRMEEEASEDLRVKTGRVVVINLGNIYSSGIRSLEYLRESKTTAQVFSLD